MGLCISFSLTAVSRDSRGTVRKGSHYHCSRPARLRPAQKQLLLLSPSQVFISVLNTSGTLAILWSVLGCSPSCLPMETARATTNLGSYSYCASKAAEICPPPKHLGVPLCPIGTVGMANASGAVRSPKVKQLTQVSHAVFWEKYTEPWMWFLEGQLGTSDGSGHLTCPASPSSQVLVDKIGGGW